MPKAVYHAYGYVKKAAIVNGRAGRLPGWKAELIGRVADEIIAGKLDSEFPLYVWQPVDNQRWTGPDGLVGAPVVIASSSCAPSWGRQFGLELAQVTLGELKEFRFSSRQDGPGRIQREALDLASG